MGLRSLQKSVVINTFEYSGNYSTIMMISTVALDLWSITFATPVGTGLCGHPPRLLHSVTVHPSVVTVPVTVLCFCAN